MKISLQLVLVAVFVLMIVYFLRRYSADISGLQSLSLLDVLLICIWSFVSYTAYAYAVYAMLISAGLKDVDPYGWLRIYFVSRLVNFFVIQGGNLYRLVLLKNKYNFSYANSIGITAFLIWLNASIALLVSSYILATMEWRPGDFVDNLLVWSVAGLVILLLTPLLLVKSVTTFKCLATLPTKFLEPALKITDHFVATMKNRRLMMKITCLSCIHFFFFVGASYFSFRAIGQTVDVVAVCIFTTVFVFTRYINIVPGNIGLSELVGGLVSEQLGIGFGNGLLVSGIVRMIEILMIIFFGLFYGKFLLLEYFRNRPKVD